MSRKAFEAACKAHGWPLGIRTDGSYVGSTEVRWGAWQAAESHTARKIVAMTDKTGPELIRWWGTGQANAACQEISSAIRSAYPDAFKEGE